MSRDHQRIVREANAHFMQQQTRRHFFQECVTGMGAMALGSVLGGCNWLASKDPNAIHSNPLMAHAPHFAGKAKSVIYL
ncbi:MAG: sulfatase, partial [Bacteroidota bacterium]